MFEGAVKYGIDVLALLCLQDMCNTQSLNINTAALLLICLHQALNGSYEKYHSNDYKIQIKNLKQTVLRYIQSHSREILLSSQWKLLEKHYPSLVHDVLEFVVFEKIVE
jgi:maltooligosyltrehalose synthase